MSKLPLTSPQSPSEAFGPRLGCELHPVAVSSCDNGGEQMAFDWVFVVVVVALVVALVLQKGGRAGRG